MTVKHPIGLVSGLGPLAGEDVLAKALDYAARAYDAVEDTDYPDLVLISRGVEGFDATGDTANLRAALIDSLSELDLHQPSVVGIACNTAHLMLDAIREHSTGRFVSIVEETAREASLEDHRYLFLSSSSTRFSHLYEPTLARFGVQYVTVSEAEQLALDEVVHLVVAHELRTAGSVLTDLVSSLSYDFDAIIAACTELPIAIAHSELAERYSIVDSNRALAEALVDGYYAYNYGERCLAALNPQGARS